MSSSSSRQQQPTSVASLAATLGKKAIVEGFSAANTTLTSTHDHELLAAIHNGNESVMTTEATETCSGIYRNVTESQLTYDQFFSRRYGGPHKSLAASFKLKCAEYGDARRAIAWRPLGHVEKVQQPASLVKPGEKPKTWEVLHLAETQYMTFSQLWAQIAAFGAGLSQVGLTAGAQVGIYAETCKEWIISCYGLWTQQLVGVTVYANLGEDALLYAIKEAEMKAIICSAKGAQTVARICAKAGIATPILIIMADVMSSEAPKPPSPVASSSSSPASSSANAVVVSHMWTDVVAAGEAAIRKGTAVEKMPQSADETALIMYTSGTTGDPKGVVLTHGNIYAGVQSFDYRLKQYLAGTKEDPTYVGYLPLAHILEFGAENCFLMGGAMVGYGTPRTLTSMAAKPHGDLEEFKPMFFVGVPRIFDTILKGVQAKIPKGIAGDLFHRAYKDRVALYREGVVVEGYNKSVFANTRATVGGRCRCVVSGGAPLSAKTQEYMSVIFGCPVVQGYGLTETCAIGTLPGYWDMRREVIGPILPGVEIKLHDVSTWRHNDQPNPRGEIWLRGPTVTKGYYKQAAKTREAFTEDGWLKTGDVGEMMPNGTMKIIGRVKSLAKNLNGEYIAMETLESVYVQNELCVPNGVCVLVDAQRAYITALVCTDENKAKKFAAKIGIENPQWPQVLQNPKFQQRAALSLSATAKKNGRKSFEFVKKVRVLSDEWTPENGILTAAMKLKRTAVDAKYKDVIADLFDDEEDSAKKQSSKL